MKLTVLLSIITRSLYAVYLLSPIEKDGIKQMKIMKNEHRAGRNSSFALVNTSVFVHPPRHIKRI